MAMRKTEVERIIDNVFTAAGKTEVEVADLLEKHWEACERRRERTGSPHRPEWILEANSAREDFTRRSAGLDPADPTVRSTFERLIESCVRVEGWNRWNK